MRIYEQMWYVLPNVSNVSCALTMSPADASVSDLRQVHVVEKVPFRRCQSEGHEAKRRWKWRHNSPAATSNFDRSTCGESRSSLNLRVYLRRQQQPRRFQTCNTTNHPTSKVRLITHPDSSDASFITGPGTASGLQASKRRRASAETHSLHKQLLH